LSASTTARTHTRRQKTEAWLGSGRGNGAAASTRGARLLQAGAGLGAAGAARWRVAGQAGDGAAMARARSEHAAHKAGNWRHGMLLSRCPRAAAPGCSPDLCRRACPPGRPGPAAASRCLQRGALHGGAHLRPRGAWFKLLRGLPPVPSSRSKYRICYIKLFCREKLFAVRARTSFAMQSHPRRISDCLPSQSGALLRLKGGGLVGGCSGSGPLGGGRCPFEHPASLQQRGARGDAHGAGPRATAVAVTTYDVFCPCERVRVCKLLALTTAGPSCSIGCDASFPSGCA